MNSTMPSRMRASEIRNWPISKPKEQRLEPVADVGARKTPLQHQERQGADDQRQRERDLGQAASADDARRIQAEALFQQVADRDSCGAAVRASRRGWPDSRARSSDDDAGQHQLLRDEARQRNIAEQGRRRMASAMIQSGTLSQRGVWRENGAGPWRLRSKRREQQPDHERANARSARTTAPR